MFILLSQSGCETCGATFYKNVERTISLLFHTEREHWSNINTISCWNMELKKETTSWFLHWRMCKRSHLTYDQHYFDSQTNLLTKRFWRQNLQFLLMDKFPISFVLVCSPLQSIALQWSNPLVAKFVIVIFQYWQLIEQWAVLNEKILSSFYLYPHLEIWTDLTISNLWELSP